MVDLIAIRDGEVFVVNVGSDFSEPIHRRIWYPTGIAANPYIRELVQEQDNTPLHSLGEGCYMDSFHRRWQLVNGGKTTPRFFEEFPFPCPSAHGKETRYYQGRWEKYLKTRGWVPA